jgi:hypothetical protein
MASFNSPYCLLSLSWYEYAWTMKIVLMRNNMNIKRSTCSPPWFAGSFIELLSLLFTSTSLSFKKIFSTLYAALPP